VGALEDRTGGVVLKPPAPGFTIRPSRRNDLEAVYEVCLKTGDVGEDATHLYADPHLLGHLYAGPYVTLEPDLAFVLEDDAGVCGYVIGALDSESFYARLETAWFPALRERYLEPTGDPEAWTRDERLVHQMYHLSASVPPGYPSHLHIDLLPRAQGRGNGRALMERLFAALREKGSPAVHLGTSPRNVRAERFYKKLGFTELVRKPNHLVLGRRL